MHSAFMRSMKLRGCKGLSASCNSSPTSTCQCIPGRGRTFLGMKPIRWNPLLAPSPHLRLSSRRKTQSLLLKRLHRRSRRHRASSQAFYLGHLPHYSSSIPRDETWHSILHDTSPPPPPHADSEPGSDESFSGTDSSCSSCSSIASLSTLEDMAEDSASETG